MFETARPLRFVRGVIHKELLKVIGFGVAVSTIPELLVNLRVN